MTELSKVVGVWVAPALREKGFDRRRNVFRYEKDFGFVSVVIRRHDADENAVYFYVEIEVCPAIGVEWWLHDAGLGPADAAQVIYGLWHNRILQTESSARSVRDINRYERPGLTTKEWCLSKASDGALCGEDLRDQIVNAVAMGVELLVPGNMLRDYEARGNLVSSFLRLKRYKSRALLTAAENTPTSRRRALDILAHADGQPGRDPEGDCKMARWISNRS